jgi:hypothetical protein
VGVVRGDVELHPSSDVGAVEGHRSGVDVPVDLPDPGARGLASAAAAGCDEPGHRACFLAVEVHRVHRLSGEDAGEDAECEHEDTGAASERQFLPGRDAHLP